MSAPPLPAASAPRPVTAPTASIGAAPRERLVALDAVRGLTVAAMLLVNDPGNSDAVYAPLAHSAWNGCTIADFVFPFFLFIVGITTHLSLAAHAGRGDAEERRQIVRRGAFIVGLGLLLNWIPFYQSGAVDGVAHAHVVDRVVARLAGLRLPGVLQRIGVVYLAAALLSRRASSRRVACAAAALLLGHWLALTTLPVPGEGASGAALLGDSARTLSAWLDRAAFDWTRWGLGNHLRDGGAFDPEGVLSTAPALATTLLGVLAGRWLDVGRSLGSRLARLALAGALGVGTGLLWSPALPINKALWTGSYVLLTAGACALLLAAATWIVDARGAARWTRPLVVYGSNPLIAFVGSELMATFVHSTIRFRVAGQRVSLQEATYRWGFASWLPPRAASLGYALLFVLAWYAILAALYRRRLFLKV